MVTETVLKGPQEDFVMLIDSIYSDGHIIAHSQARVHFHPSPALGGVYFIIVCIEDVRSHNEFSMEHEKNVTMLLYLSARVHSRP